MNSLSNALILIDAQQSLAFPSEDADRIAKELHTFLRDNEDGYKLVVAVRSWEPDAANSSFPDALNAFDPVSQTAPAPGQVEFDRLFWKGRFGVAISAFDSTENAVEPLDDYSDLFSLDGLLRRNTIAHVDLAGYGIALFTTALEAVRRGYETTVLMSYALDLEGERCDLLLERGVHLDGWTR